MNCEFVNQLSRLRKLSVESVDNPDSFSDLNRYMHVTRVVETELKEILRKVHRNQHKTLVLLCGSAGDGKSHLLSYLKNEDEECLLEGIEIYNDATESAEPHLTAIDTLAERLKDFSDEHLDNGVAKKLILAINLGVLNNFIESEKGQAFKKLKLYVEESEIFSSFTRKAEYKENSPFQHVSFSDFHLFTLKNGKIKTDYLNELFNKVFAQVEENPFYRCYSKNNQNCNHCSECPVRHNYELMFDSKIRESIINQLVEVSIKDKSVVTTREILNFIYDILVHSDFMQKDFFKQRVHVTQLIKYLEHTTPILAYEQADVSSLLNGIRKHDFLRYRTAKLDQFSLSYHTSNDISHIFNSSVKGTPFKKFKKLVDGVHYSESNHEYKEKLYRFIIRLNDLKQERDSIDNSSDFKEFIKHLYYQNLGQSYNLDSLYEDTLAATKKWNGDFGDSHIGLDDFNENYWVAEEIGLSPLYPDEVENVDDEELMRFEPTLKVAFYNEYDSTAEPVELTIDFCLFKLIKSMNRGYCPTIEDKNSHANFVSFVHQVVELGKKTSKIELISKANPTTERFVFTKVGRDSYQFRKK